MMRLVVMRLVVVRLVNVGLEGFPSASYNLGLSKKMGVVLVSLSRARSCTTEEGAMPLLLSLPSTFNMESSTMR